MTIRDEYFRRAVASLPCAECGIEGYSQAAHANNQIFGKCRGKKSSDLATFPLCCTRPGDIGCHTRHDQYIGITKFEAQTREYLYIAETYMALMDAGVLNIDKKKLK